MMGRSEIRARFEAKYAPADMGHGTPCWLWSASLDRDGYARFSRAHGDTVGAHRWAYEEFVGPIPEGLHLDHLCRNRSCVNPAHLEPVTCRENLMRGDTYAAHATAKTECKYGHPFDAVNTYIAPNGTRKCKTCQRRRKVEHALRRAAA